jgi:hypothetical protein
MLENIVIGAGIGLGQAIFPLILLVISVCLIIAILCILFIMDLMSKNDK